MARTFSATYSTTQTLSNPATDNPATVTSTGTIDVNSTIASAVGLYGSAGTAWSITNLGTVESVGSLGVGIQLISGGAVTNGSSGATSALIDGSTGLEMFGAVGTVDNYATIAGSYGSGIWLAAGGTVSNSGTIESSGSFASITIGNSGSGAGTVSNIGLIQGSGTDSAGVWLEVGGIVTNGQSSSSGGTISGYGRGVLATGASGQTATVVNYGLIESTGAAASSRTVDLEAGGTVTNFGTILGASSASLGLGVFLGAGGSVTNAASGLIAGYGGVEIVGAAGTLTNHGTIQSTGTGFGAQAVDLLTGGTVTNYGKLVATNTAASGINAGTGPSHILNATGALIEGWLNGIDQFSSTGTVVNAGTVESTNGDGVYLQTGGAVTNSGTIEGPGGNGIVIRLGTGDSISNASTGLITGGFRGVEVDAALGTVSNAGTIAASSFSGVALFAGGTIANTSTSALISGVPDAAYISGAIGTVSNLGTIKSTGATSIALHLAAGGSVTNGATGATTALITGGRIGVDITGGAGTLVNFATIEGTATVGFGVYFGQGGSVNNSGTIIGGAGVYLAGAGTVTNSGTIISTNTAFSIAGVHLSAGGSVNNLGTASLIDGNSLGIYLCGTVGTVTNAGTIIGGTDKGVALYDGGTVVNSGTIIGGADKGVAIYGAVGTVKNSGTIIGSGDQGVALYSGGLVSNSGNITGSTDNGVVIDGAVGTVGNSGTITGGNGKGVALYQGGTVTNSGTITGSDDKGVAIYGAVGKVKNTGTIIGTYQTGVALYMGGSVLNSAGLIGGSTGVYIGGGTGTVTNSATINGAGPGGDGVSMSSGGSVTNQAGGTITGASSAGVDINGGTGTVDNSGAIEGTGAYAAGVALLAGGTVNNALGGVIEGPGGGVRIAVSAGTIVNLGTIESTDTANHSSPFRDAISLYDGGSVINGQSGSNPGLIVTGAKFGIGVDIRGIGSVTNYGTIAAGGTQSAGIFIGGSGAVSNFGTIVDTGRYNYYVVALFGGGTVANFGTIVEMPGVSDVGFDRYSNGVYSRQGGLVTNGQSGATAGLISAAHGGVYISGGVGTVVNFGTISGTGTNGIGVDLVVGGTVTDLGRITGASGTAVSFGGTSANRLILEPGYHLGGKAVGSTGVGATNTLELGSAASAGTLSAAIASKFLHFDTVTIDAGARWTLTGSNSLAGVTLTDFGTLTNAGTLNSASLIIDPASLINSGSIGTTVTLAGGSYLKNKPTGMIAVGEAPAVYGIGGAATVVNAGRIIGTGAESYGVDLAAGGRVSNTVATALIDGYADGISIGGSGGSVSNRGTVLGDSGNGVTLISGVVANGATNATGAVISGSHFGVNIQSGAGTVVNFGSITSSADTGVWFNAGTIVNGPSGATHALISGAFDGVFVAVGRGTVANYGTVVGGSSNDGVCLYAGGLVTNGRSGATAALIQGHASGVEIQHALGTVVNLGTIAATVSGGIGIDLEAGGTVTDSGRVVGGSGTAISFGGTSANRLILGPGYHLGGKVFGSLTAGATNSLELGPGAGIGTVSSVIATEFVQFGAVKVDGGAHWVLTSNNTIAAGHTLTVNGTLTDLGTLTNLGMINGSGRLIIDPATLFNSGSIGTTVSLVGGGYLGNKTAGKITAAGDGVFGIGGAATVVNQGQITGTAGTGVQLLAGGRVTNRNSGAIAGGNGGVYILGSAGTVVNYGTISVTRSGGAAAIYLGAGGNVVNHGVVTAVASTGTNGSHGIELRGAGTITNLGQIAVGGTHGDGVKIKGGGILVNLGTVMGGSAGVSLQSAGANVKNGQSSTGSSLLVGYFTGVAGIASDLTLGNFGTITNFGTIESTSFATSYGGLALGAIIGGAGRINNSGLITGPAAGIALTCPSGGGAVVNSGRIVGGAGTGVQLTGGGRVSNQSSGSIIGGDGGVYILGGVGTVSNSGTIASSSGSWDGIFLNTGGSVSNSGVVSGLDGVDLRSGGTVTNSGKIIGGGSGNVAGVFLGFNYSAGAFRVNNTGSVISTATGILMRGAGTITNGSSAATGATIRGSIGVQLFGVGTVVNFGTITGTSGIAIGLGTGNDRVVIEKGSVLNGAVAGFHIGDTFDLPFMSFSSAGTVTLGANNVLRVVENGGTFNIKLDPSQNFTGDFFHLASDGSTGTLITENHTPPAPWSISPNPAKVLDNAGHLTFTITRTDTSGPAVVYASVEQDQGFTNNGDYTFVNDTEVNFAAGVASVKVSVGIIDTGAASGSEVFRFIIQQHKTDPVSTFLASDKFTITNTTAAAASPRLTFADIAPAGPTSGAANSGGPSSYLPGAIAANEQSHAGGQLLFGTGHSGGSLLSLTGGANHHSLLPA